MFANCLGNLSFENGLFISLAAGGFVGSLSHCTGMCGPFVLAQIGVLPEKSGFFTRMLLPYHLGRMTTYTLLGLVFGAVVNMAAFYALPKTVLSVLFLALAGVMFLVAAIPGLAAVFPWLAKPGLPVSYDFIARLSRPLALHPAGWRGYALGAMLGLMPCGLVVAALMAAGSAGTAAGAGFAMLAFGAGTVPALLLMACGGNWIRYKWPVQVKLFSAIMMAVNSLILFWLALNAAI